MRVVWRRASRPGAAGRPSWMCRKVGVPRSVNEGQVAVQAVLRQASERGLQPPRSFAGLERGQQLPAGRSGVRVVVFC